jgi:acetyl-CoA C-acetyltransferase
MNEIVIVAAKRTPIGKFLGAFKNSSAVDLACAAGHAVLEGIDRCLIDQVIVGNVLGAGQGMNIARQIGLRLELPQTVPAYTINMMCASGMQAVLLAAQAIRAGEAHTVLCGGTESMSNAPYLLSRARTGLKYGNTELVDSLLSDGLHDPFDHRHMALTAQTLAEDYQISREEQDQFALRSQQLFEAARAAGRFDAEVVPVGSVTQDQHPRPDTVLEGLSNLASAFGPGGTITAGNASGLNDGAAMLVIADRTTAVRNRWPVLAVLEQWATVGCEPARMGLGPVHAIRKLEERGLPLARCESFEINEAFAAQTLACALELRLDPDRLNPDGGAISVGHPIGASGARLLVHLAQRVAAGAVKRSVAALCVGGGQGIAAVVRS